MDPLQSRAVNWKVSFSGGLGLMGGSAVDAMEMTMNKRVNIVRVGVVLARLREDGFSWEEVDVDSGGPVWGRRYLISGRGVTPPYRGQVGGVNRRTDVYPKIVWGRISLIGDHFRSNNNNMAAGKSWGSGCWFQGDCATGLVCLCCARRDH